MWAEGPGLDSQGLGSRFAALCCWSPVGFGDLKNSDMSGLAT
jgi:hypothetical protein